MTALAPRAVAFDLETTGVDAFSDVPVSYGFVERDAGGALVVESGLVNPGRPIPRGATAVHGITDAMVADAPDLEGALDLVCDRLGTLWAGGGVVVGMNVAYDLTMVDALCRRFSRPPLDERGLGAVVDILVLDRHVDRYRKGKRTLGALCAHYGVDPGDAHSASGDAAASLAVFERIVERYPDLAAIPVTDITARLAEWYREWLSGFSAYLVKKGDRAIEPGRYAWPVHEAPSP
jgi:DNA polymerase III subunit epsilon